MGRESIDPDVKTELELMDAIHQRQNTRFGEVEAKARDQAVGIGRLSTTVSRLETDVEALKGQAHDLIHDHGTEPPVDPPVDPPIDPPIDPPVDPPIDPPTDGGGWQDEQVAVALAIRAQDSIGPQDGAIMSTSTQPIDDGDTLENIIVRDVLDFGVVFRAGGGILRHAGIYECGAGGPDKSRKPALKMAPQGSGVHVLVEDTEILGSHGPNGWGGGSNDNQITLVRVLTRDVSNGYTQNQGVAVAGNKISNFARFLGVDVMVENDTGVGTWFDGSGWRNAQLIRGLWRGLSGVAIFPELGKGIDIGEFRPDGTGIQGTGPTILNCHTGILIDADEIRIASAVIKGTLNPVLLRAGPRDGKVRNVVASFTDSYVEFFPNSKFGLARVPVNNGDFHFECDHNTYANLDPAARVFRWLNTAGNVKSYNFEEWQGLGFDQNSVVV